MIYTKAILFPVHNMFGHGWRYNYTKIRVRCDFAGCGAEIEARGTDHNGPQLERLYLHREDGPWQLSTVEHPRDLCPLHTEDRGESESPPG